MKHTVSEAIRRLNTKQDCKVTGDTILVLSDHNQNKVFDLGNKSWGRIDFLVNYCGFRKFFFDKF